jgi:U3 small nucleolar RNA-associated protein 14
MEAEKTLHEVARERRHNRQRALETLLGSAADKCDKHAAERLSEEDRVDDDDFSDDEDVESESDRGGALLNFVENLAGRPSSVSNNVEDRVPQKLPESEFSLPGSTSSRRAVSLSALLSSLEGAEGIKDVRKRVEGFASGGGGIKPPAAAVVAARAEREVAYEQAAEEATKWIAPVQAARQSEVADFRPKVDALASRPTTGALTDRFEPRQGMEAEVAELLRGDFSRGEGQEAMIEAEEQEAVQDLSPEEADKRLADLRRTRALLFYHERKRHQVNKIKSKLYRKKHRKKRLRESSQVSAEALAADPELAKLEEERKAVARAKERATLRHSAKSLAGKRGFARHVAASEASEAAAIERELRQKAVGGDSSSDDDSDATSSEEDGVDSNPRLSSRDRSKLDVIGTPADPDLAGKLDKGLLGMKFMQRAIAKQQDLATRERDELLRELGDEDDEGGREDPMLEALEPLGEHAVTGRIGRGFPTAVSGSVTVNIKGVAFQGADRLGSQEENPWIAESSRSRRNASNNRSTAGASTIDLDPVRAAKRVLATTPAEVTEGNSAPEPGRRRKRSRSRGKNVQDDGPSSTPAEEVEKEAPVVKRPAELTQAELVARAFAAPDLEEEFKISKQAEMEQDAEDAVGSKKGKAGDAMGMAGWGSWTGMGAPQPRKSRRQIETEKLARAKKEAAKQGRADASLPTVIINPKRQKRSAPLKLAQVPYPFTSRAQYERAMRQPLGPEWNTTQSVRDLNKKEVLTRAGASIAPLRVGGSKKG